jgi:hypothetical protein
VAAWFETREDALLTMRTEDEPHPEEPAFAGVSKDGASGTFSYSFAIASSVVTVFQFRVVALRPRTFSIALLDSLVSP